MDRRSRRWIFDRLLTLEVDKIQHKCDVRVKSLKIEEQIHTLTLNAQNSGFFQTGHLQVAGRREHG